MAKYKKFKFFTNKNTKLLIALFLSIILLIFSFTFVFINKTIPENDITEAADNNNLYGIAAGGILTGLNDAELNRYFDDMKNIGVQWIRFDISWSEIQWNSQTTYNWDRFDAVINAATSRGIKVLGIFAYVPPWALPAGCSDNWHCPPRDNQQFANFTKLVVERYAPRGVHAWEIWNEPNGGTMDPATYTALMKSVYPVIKAADPSAFILAGGSMPVATGGNSYSPIDYLKGIYANGGKNYFDGLTHHPYCWGGGTSFNCPKAFADWSAWSQIQETNPSLRSVMLENNDGQKPIWGTEFGAPTGGGTITPEAQQAQEVIDSYTLWKTYTWSGPLFWYQYKDRCTTQTDVECYFGLIRYDGTQKPAYNAYKSLATANPSPNNIPEGTITITNTPFTTTIVPTISPTYACLSTSCISSPTPSISAIITDVPKNDKDGNNGKRANENFFSLLLILIGALLQFLRNIF